MNRVVTSESRLTNNSLCGIDQPFCYPITRPWDNIFYLKPPVNEDFTFSTLNVYDGNNNIILVLTETTLHQYFAYQKALDSNGEIYFMLRLKRPLYNLGSEINPEVTCYRFYFALLGESGDLYEWFSEPSCAIDSFTVKHCVIIADPNDTDSIDFEIECNNDGNPQIYTTASLPNGMWVEYIGPYVDIFMPENCDLISATLGATNLSFQCSITQTFGVQNCGPYVTLEGNANFLYDCKGRYYTQVKQPADEPYQFNPYSLPGLISSFNIHIQGARVKTLASKTTVKRYKQSCFIPNTEKVNRYKIYSMCPHPAWFIEELNIIAGTQAVTITGTNPVADDNDVLISTMMADDTSWKERQYSQFFYPILFFETCTCYTNFSC